MPVYREMSRVEDVTDRYDLLLSPQFYLMKKEKLPVRFSFEARRVAPSLLEELGADIHWSFEVFREGKDHWIVVAYNPSEILDTIEKAGLSPDRIGKLYFAQQFIDDLETPLQLDDQRALIVMDGTVTLVPVSLVELGDSSPKKLDEMKRPSTAFTLHGESGRVRLGSREALWISLALLLLGVIWTTEGIRYRKAKTSLVEKTQKLTEQNPALASSIVRKNIHDQYAAVDRLQRQVRDTLRRIGRLISKESKLSHLKVDARGYTAVIEASGNRLATLKKLADSADLPATIKGTQLVLHGEWK